MKKLLMIIIFVVTFMAVIGAPITLKDYSTYATNTLISPKTAKNIVETEKNIVILDLRKEENFKKEHIKGSYKILGSDFTADKEEYGYIGMRATPKKIEKVLGLYGINTDTHIILIGEGSARLWWILDMYGHENISIIDGGISGWKSAGLEVAHGDVTSPVIKSIYEFTNPLNLSKLARLEDVKSVIKDSVVIDTRTYFESDGFVKDHINFEKGKIPGSYNIPWENMINQDRTFKTVKEIEVILDNHEITKDKKIILYSNLGSRSAYMTFVFKELLGYKDVKNYDGSWIQWSHEYKQGNVEIERDNIFKIVLSYFIKRQKLESMITSLGIWGPLVFILIYIVTTVSMLPALPATIASGIIFGPIMGVVYTSIGAGLGLSLSFLIARYIARGTIEKKFGETVIFKKIDEGVKKDGWFILAVTRLIPIFPFSIQNYVYGLTSIGFFQYSILSLIFIIPGTSVFVMLAGAFTSGDKEVVFRYSITASLIFMGLMVVTKIVKKKWRG